MANPFIRATRKATRLRIGLEAPSGAGKTYTALRLASELAEHDGGRVAVIDSERGSSSKYSDGRPYDFDMVALDDRNPQSYVDALHAAGEAKYPAIVIDSASHEWKGVLALVDTAGQRMGGNTWAGWAKGRPAHDAFVDEVIAAPAHVIATFRSKQETEQYKDGGQTKVRKLGLAPVTADDMDYEFDVWGSIAHDDHTVIIAKSRIDTIPVGSEWPRGEGLVAAYLAWVDGAEYAEPDPVPVRREPEPPPARANSRPAREPRPPQPRQSAPVQSGLNDFMQWALREHGMSRQQVCEVLHVQNVTEIDDFDAARTKIIAAVNGVTA